MNMQPLRPKSGFIIILACVFACTVSWQFTVSAQEADVRAAVPAETASPPGPAAPKVTAPQPAGIESAGSDTSAQGVLPSATAVPEVPAPQPGTPVSAGPETPKQGILLNFQDASLDAVLEYLSEVAGFNVVRETPVEGRITIMSRQPLSTDEVVSLLNTALTDKGYAAIVMGRTLKIVPLADAKKRNVPVILGNEPGAIEPSDRIVTQIIPVKYVDAVRLKQDITPLMSAYAELAANASSNSLILTDTEANIRRIVEIVHALDAAMSGVTEVKVFQLKYANATNAAQLINNLFKTDTTAQQQSGTAAGGGRGRFLAGGPGGAGGAGGAPNGSAPSPAEQGRGSLKVTASADDRTNTLVVSGSPDMLKVIESVVKELDSSPAAVQAVFIYRLNNGSAANLQTVLNNLFSLRVASTSGGGGTAARPNPTTTSATSSLQTADSLAGQVYVVANVDTNSLMVMTASKNFAQVKEIIAELDRPVPQVLIKVLIAEVTLDKSLDLGTEFSALDLNAAGHGVKAATDFGLSGILPGITFNLLGKDINATLVALQKVGKLDVLSRPYILGSDNQKATITVGQQVPFITSSRTTDTGQTINTIQYQDIGIILNVTPHINPEGLVILDVSPEISALTGTTVPISETVNAPVFAKRSATSRVAIQDGQTIVIGGLMQDQKTEDSKKVPLLGEIPIFGALFRRTTTDNTKTELLIFLTPQIANQSDTLKKISADELKDNGIINKAVTPGTFDKYLKGMNQSESGPSNPDGKQGKD
jgi:general secretion pathway protein D